MKNCEDIRGRLTLYLDNELQGDERAASRPFGGM